MYSEPVLFWMAYRIVDGCKYLIEWFRRGQAESLCFNFLNHCNSQSLRLLLHFAKERAEHLGPAILEVAVSLESAL